MTQNRNLSIHADYVSTAGVLNPSGGGLGITSTPANGQIPIGNGTNYTAATITQGTGITVTNGAGSIAIATTNVLPAPGASGNVLTSNGTSWVSNSNFAGIKVWCNFDGTLSGTITPSGSLNVSSIVKNGTGDYTINFTNPFATSYYAWSGSCVPNGAETVGGTVRGYSTATQTVSSCRIRTLGQTTTLYDTTTVNFMAVGN